jgi:hypothetical protein
MKGENAGTKPHPGTAILEQASRKVNQVGDRQDGKYDKNFVGFQSGRTKIVFLEEVLRISPSDKISRFFGCPPAQHPRSALLANQLSTAAIPFPFSATEVLADLFLDLVNPKSTLLRSMQRSIDH